MSKTDITLIIMTKEKFLEYDASDDAYKKRWLHQVEVSFVTPQPQGPELAYVYFKKMKASTAQYISYHYGASPIIVKN